MRKPQFGIVIGLLAVFFVLALVRNTFEKYIPLGPTNKLANLPGAFLRNAANEPIDWQPDFGAAVEKARRLKRPCFLVMGSASSKIGRLMDQRVFSVLSVAAYVNASFVPIRIDLTDQPKWVSAVFPITKMKIPFTNGFQLLILDENGRFIKFIPPPEELSQIDPTQFSDLLISIRSEYLNRLDPNALGDDTKRQMEDVSELAALGQRMVPAFNQFASAVYDVSSAKNGAFFQSGYLKMLPLAWRYLAAVGREQSTRQTLGPYLLSPAVDLVRGGFYEISESTDSMDVDFCQQTVLNAEMAQTLAIAGVIQQSGIFTQLGRRTFDMILRDLSLDDIFVTERPSNLDSTTDLSPTASFPQTRLSGLLNPDQLSWAEDHLNLNRFDNRQWIPYLDSGASMNQPIYRQILGLLLRSDQSTEVKQGDQYLDVDGATLAALCECTRVWGDPVRLQELDSAFGQLEKFTSFDDVCHTRAPALESGYLGDYLAFSDAQLQFYLSTGKQDHFESGLKILLRAIDLFYNSRTLQFQSVSDSERQTLPPLFDNPGLCDEVSESTTAEAIRLCMAYGRMLGPTDAGGNLVKIASDSVGKYAGLNVATSPSIAGFYLASADLGDPECAFVVGPNAQETADRLFRLRPTRLVAAVRPGVRPDLASRSPGVYLATSSAVSGPFSVENAAKYMPLIYQLGVTPEP
jgi:uncharacterized protein YyaL (SSP411 family)